MGFSLARVGERARSTFPAIKMGRLLENAGFLARDANADELALVDTLTDIGGDTAPAPIEGELQPSMRRRLRDAIAPNDNLRKKFAAWWNGDILNNERSPATVLEVDLEFASEQPEWAEDRIHVNEALWGESHLEPGGPTAITRLFSPVMPNSKMTVLDLAAGLGGTSLTLAKTQNLWMDAFEPDPALANRARRNAQLYGLSNQVPVGNATFESMPVKAQKYDMIFVRDRLFAVENKLDVLKQAADGLKSGGNLVIIDYMLADEEAEHSPELEDWRRHEPGFPKPWTMAHYKGVLHEFGLSTWSSHDLTSDYLSDTYAGWNRVIEQLETGEFDRKLADALVREGEIWLGRTRAMEAQQLLHCRIIAQRT